MKKLDKILIFSILLIAGVLMAYSYIRSNIIANKSEELVVVISVKGKPYKEVPLKNSKEQFTIDTELGKNTVRIYDGGVDIIDSDCHDHICEKTGFINKPGEMIVCLPHKVFIKIEGKTGEGIDGISR